MTIRETVLEILQNINDDNNYETATKIIDDKLLDSFQIVSFVSELCVEFDINISPKWLVPEHFNTIEAIVNMIETVLEEE